jgi:hypothetical protein
MLKPIVYFVGEVAIAFAKLTEFHPRKINITL